MHEGHRNRLKSKFLKNGLDSFEPHELLELLLFYSVPRKDTNELGHELLNSFGSLSAVFDAPIESLMTVKVVGEASATLIKLIPEICRKYMEDKYDHRNKVIHSKNAGEVFMSKFVGRVNEAVALMLLDSKCKLLFCGIVNEGSVNACDIYVRKLVELSIKYNASMAIIAHNHPSGIALPSRNDIQTTILVRDALRLVGIRLIDHIIVADDDYVSMSQSKLNDKVFEVN